MKVDDLLHDKIHGHDDTVIYRKCHGSWKNTLFLIYRYLVLLFDLFLWLLWEESLWYLFAIVPSISSIDNTFLWDGIKYWNYMYIVNFTVVDKRVCYYTDYNI